jgi:hypothetical protein
VRTELEEEESGSLLVDLHAFRNGGFGISWHSGMGDTAPLHEKKQCKYSSIIPTIFINYK